MSYIPVLDLWLPILLATVLVFFASFLTWAVLKFHSADWSGLSNEDEVRAALNRGGVQPGQYFIPHEPDQARLKDPEVQRKFEEGPVAVLYVRKPGFPEMGKNIVQMFVFQLVISTLVAYVLGRTIPPGEQYMQVFRVAGTVALLAYGGAVVPFAIWFAHSWKATVKDLVDALVYALLTAGAFAGFWPG